MHNALALVQCPIGAQIGLCWSIYFDSKQHEPLKRKKSFVAVLVRATGWGMPKVQYVTYHLPSHSKPYSAFASLSQIFLSSGFLNLCPNGCLGFVPPRIIPFRTYMYIESEPGSFTIEHCHDTLYCSHGAFLSTPAPAATAKTDAKTSARIMIAGTRR